MSLIEQPKPQPDQRSTAPVAAPSVNIRQAGLSDRDLFLNLWQKFLIEQRQNGSEVQPTQRTMLWVANVLGWYVSGVIPGVALLVGNHAALLWGGLAATPYDTDLGLVAFANGTYVEPEHRNKGIAQALWKEAIQRLKSLGFNSILVTPQVSNEKVATRLEKHGFLTTQHIMVRYL